MLKISKAGYGLFQWANAMVKYYDVAKTVEPKRKLVKDLSMKVVDNTKVSGVNISFDIDYLGGFAPRIKSMSKDILYPLACLELSTHVRKERAEENLENIQIELKELSASLAVLLVKKLLFTNQISGSSQILKCPTFNWDPKQRAKMDRHGGGIGERFGCQFLDPNSGNFLDFRKIIA